jgi:Flp pilus assembly protein TadB
MCGDCERTAGYRRTVDRNPSPAIYAVGGCGLLLAVIAGAFAGQWVIVLAAALAAAYLFMMAVVIRRRS